MKISTVVRAAVASCIFALASQVSAAVIYEFDSAGKLSVAKGVTVLGKTYDVSFVDGSCSSLFNGCNAASDFTFQNRTDARSAASALLAQVFIDTSAGSFDSVANKVAGCTSLSQCETFIPYELRGATEFGHVAAANYYGSNEWADSIPSGSAARIADYSGATGAGSRVNFAKFQLVDTSVPEPSSIALMGLAFTGLAFSRRRKS